MARHVADGRLLLTERDLQNPLPLEVRVFPGIAGKTYLNGLDGKRSEYRPVAPAASQWTDP